VDGDLIVRPVRLGPNTPDTFYRGAGRISAFRGTAFDPHPEDWVASTTARFGAAPAGLTRLADGSRLADVIAADPSEWLGVEAAARFDANPGLLVKLLDAGQRLPLHVHPDRRFARSHLASPFGKTEAWVILDAPADAYVHLGFARDVEAAELAGWVDSQDVTALLAATNRIGVAPGDAVLCPAGTPHAIGEGILLLELQEPTDFSVLLEWDGFALTADDATLGLPRALALECVDRSRCDDDRLAALRGRPNAIGTVLPAEADAFFIAERVRAGELEADFSILVVTAGGGQLHYRHGDPLPISRGDTIVVPYSAGPVRLVGDMTSIRCRASRCGLDGAD
jgi:mannose-6-phosphate isomerase